MRLLRALHDPGARSEQVQLRPRGHAGDLQCGEPRNARHERAGEHPLRLPARGLPERVRAGHHPIHLRLPLQRLLEDVQVALVCVFSSVGTPCACFFVEVSYALMSLMCLRLAVFLQCAPLFPSVNEHDTSPARATSCGSRQRQRPRAA